MSTELIDVRMPDGTIVSGVPKGISQSEVLRRYQASQAPAADTRTGLQVAKDQAVAAAKGFVSPITSIPAQIEQEGIGKTLARNLTPVGIAQGIWGGIKSVGEDVVPNIVKNSAALVEAYGGPKSLFGVAPSSTENEKAATAAGATAGGLTLAEGIAKVAPRFNPSAETLAKTAANLREPVAPSSLSRFGATGVIGAGVAQALGIPWMEGAAATEVIDLIRRNPTVRATVAAGLDKIAEFKTMGQGQGVMNPNVDAIAAAVAEDQARPREAPVQSVANNGIDPRTGKPWVPAAAERAPTPAVNISRPGPPAIAEAQLAAARAAETPADQFARLQAQRDALAGPRQPFTESQPVNVERPPAQPIPTEPLPPRISPESINKWMGTRADDVMHGANPGKQIISEGLLAPTKEATLANVDSALKSAGMQLEARLKTADAAGTTIDAQTPVYDAKATVVKRIGAPKDETFQNQVQGVVDDIESKYPDLGRLKPSDAHKLKVELGNSIDWKNTDNPVNQMMKQIYRSINDSVASADESIAPTQARWGNLYIALRNLKSAIAKDMVGRGTGPQPAPPKFGFGLSQP